MREVTGNIWESRADVIVLTTNGDINANGEAIMGRGVALDAKNKYPGVPRLLAQQIQLRGNVPNFIARISPTMIEELSEPGPFSTRLRSFDLWSWPVKHHYNAPADISLIVSGIQPLLQLARDCEGSLGRTPTIAIPRPGCGNGKLSWDYVKPAIQHALDDRFTVYYSPAFDK